MTSYSKTNPIPLDKLKALKPQFEPLRPILDAGWPTIPLHETCATKRHKARTVRLGKAPIDSTWPRRKAQTEDYAITNAMGRSNR